jgi:hypothetical protein
MSANHPSQTLAESAQSRWLALSSNARQIFTSHSSEYIGFDEPDVFVDAVREVYALANPQRPGR